ncbi:MAG: ATP-binding protein [Kiritimatiellia bacterium]
MSVLGNDSVVLLATLNTLFSGSACLLITYLCLREYGSTGRRAVLFLGCGTLLYACANLIVGMMLQWLDFALTVYALLTMAAGAFVLASACSCLLRKIDPVPEAPRHGFYAYGALLVLVVLLVRIVLAGVLPSFYTALSGPTPIRQVVMGIAILEFTVAGGGFCFLYWRRERPPLVWYGMGTVLIALGLAFVALVPPGTALNWLGRSSQYLGVIYLVTALLVEGKGTHILRSSMETAYHESEARYQTLLNLLPDAVLVHKAGKCLFVNQACLKLFGLALPGGLLSRHLGDWVDPADQKRMNDLFRKTVREGRADKNIEFRIRCPNGSGVVVEMTSGFIRVGGENATMAVLRDVSDRQIREAELYRLNRILKATSASNSALLRATHEADYLHEVCRIVVECGYVRVWIGYVRSEAEKFVMPVAWAGFEEGVLKAETIRIDDEAPSRPAAGEAIRTGKPVVIRNPFAESDPHSQASCVGLPLLSDGRPFGAISIYSNKIDPFSDDELDLLTELSRDLAYGVGAIRLRDAHDAAARELSRSNHELEEFAHVASHDLKEPLRMVTGFMSLLKHRAQGQLDAKAGEYIDFAIDAGARMQRLIDDLLCYGRVGQGGERERVCLGCALQNALMNLKSGIEDSGARITHDALPEVTVNVLEMTQLFQNLIGNAIKFCAGRSPEVNIGVRREDRCWLISVSDNGIGIEAQFTERIFKIFNRLHTAEEYSGTGVGLAICKKVVERHGGRIWVESRAGQGSTFTFTLPDTAKAIL